MCTFPIWMPWMNQRCLSDAKFMNAKPQSTPAISIFFSFSARLLFLMVFIIAARFLYFSSAFIYEFINKSAMIVKSKNKTQSSVGSELSAQCVTWHPCDDLSPSTVSPLIFPYMESMAAVYSMNGTEKTNESTEQIFHFSFMRTIVF